MLFVCAGGGRFGARGVEGLDEFAHEAADEAALAIGHGVKGGDEARGAHAAEAAGGFHEEDLRTEAGGADGGGGSGGAASCDDDVVSRLGGNGAAEVVLAIGPAVGLRADEVLETGGGGDFDRRHVGDTARDAVRNSSLIRSISWCFLLYRDDPAGPASHPGTRDHGF